MLRKLTLVLLAAATLAGAGAPAGVAGQPFTGVLRQRVSLLGGAALQQLTGGRPEAVFTMDPAAFHAEATARMPAAGTFDGGALEGASFQLTTWLDGPRRRIESRGAGQPAAFTTVVLVDDSGAVISLLPAMRRALRLPPEAAGIFTAPLDVAADSGAAAPVEVGFERVRGWPADRWRWRGPGARAEFWIAAVPELLPGLVGDRRVTHPLAALAAGVLARLGPLPAGGAVVRLWALVEEEGGPPTAVLLELEAVERGPVDPALFQVPADYQWVQPPPGGPVPPALAAVGWQPDPVAPGAGTGGEPVAGGQETAP